MGVSSKFDRAVAAALSILAKGEDLTKLTLRRALGEGLANAAASAAIKQAREQFASSGSGSVASAGAAPAGTPDPNLREVTAVVERAFARIRAEEQSRCDVLFRNSQAELDKAETLISALRAELAEQVEKTAQAEKALKEVRRTLRKAQKESDTLKTLQTVTSQLQRVSGSGPAAVHAGPTV